MKNPTCFNVLFWSFLVSVSLSQTAVAQSVGINTNGNPPDPSAILDLSSTSKGMLIPRMASWERASISSPAQGLMVYDTGSRTFWYFDGIWREIGGSNGPTGPASGDLTGSYPSPTVAKIQNLDVVFGVPNDKQVLKWDALANNWKGRNDSLFLPYNAIYANNGNALFGITTNSTTNGSSALYGKRGSAGSGIVPGTTMGVWGDNSNGLGIVGTSNTGIGAYGLSFGNHGVYGYSSLANFAGVCGAHASANGIGVLGDIQNSGKAIYGRSTGTSGKAGYFENTNASNGDTTLVSRNAGFGSAGYFNISKATSGNAVMEISGNHQGDGLYSQLTNTGNYANANFRAYNQSLGGYAFYGQTELGNACFLYNTGATNNSYVLDAKTVGLNTVGNFTINNAVNTNYILKGTSNGTGGGLNLALTNVNSGATGINMTHSGLGTGIQVSAAKGKAGVFATTDASSLNETINVSTPANAKNAIFKSTNIATTEPGIYVEHSGLGNGIEVKLTKNNNTAAAIAVNTAGFRGIDVISAGAYGITASATGSLATAIYATTGLTTNSATAIKGITGNNATGCTGVYGEAGINDANGTGVRGVSYSSGTDRGAVAGINYSTGVGLYGEVTAAAGYAVYGVCGQTGYDAHAARFENKFSNSTFENVSIFTNGKGINLYLNNTNAANTQPQFRMLNAGTGNFMQWEATAGDIKASLAKSGNFKTAGTITVKNDKGIVRNSSSTQLRTEIITATLSAGSISHYNPGGFNAGLFYDITFGTAFSSAPSVYIGDLVSGSILGLTMTVENVTTTGCQIVLGNYTPYDFTIAQTQYKIIVIGAE